MSSEQTILLDGATSDLVECVIKNECLPMAKAMDIVYKSKLYRKMEDSKTGLYREGPVYLYDMLCEERGIKCRI